MPKRQDDSSASDIVIKSLKSVQLTHDTSTTRLVWIDKNKNEVPMEIATGTLEGVMQELAACILEIKLQSPKKRAFTPMKAEAFSANIDEYGNPVITFVLDRKIPFHFQMTQNQAQIVIDKLGEMLTVAKNRPTPTKQ